MLEVFVQLCGGIGLFLIGMTMMTDSLKNMAGETLRIWLSKFTGSPIKAVLSGIGLTLIGLCCTNLSVKAFSAI